MPPLSLCPGGSRDRQKAVPAVCGAAPQLGWFLLVGDPAGLGGTRLVWVGSCCLVELNQHAGPSPNAGVGGRCIGGHLQASCKVFLAFLIRHELTRGQPRVIKICPFLRQGSPTQWCELQPCPDRHCSELEERERKIIIIIVIIKRP